MTKRIARLLSTHNILFALSLALVGCYRQGFHDAATDPNHPLSKQLGSAVTAGYLYDRYQLAEDDSLVIVELSDCNKDEYIAYIFSHGTEFANWLNENDGSQLAVDKHDGIEYIRGDALIVAGAIQEIIVNEIVVSETNRIVILIPSGSRIGDHIDAMDCADRVRIDSFVECKNEVHGK